MFEQLLGKPQVPAQVAIVCSAKTVQGWEYFAVAAFKTRVERRTALLGYGHVDKSPLEIDGGVPAAVSLIDADADE
jgi:hypothetical protein